MTPKVIEVTPISLDARPDLVVELAHDGQQLGQYAVEVLDAVRVSLGQFPVGPGQNALTLESYLV